MNSLIDAYISQDRIIYQDDPAAVEKLIQTKWSKQREIESLREEIRTLQKAQGTK